MGKVSSNVEARQPCRLLAPQADESPLRPTAAGKPLGDLRGRASTCSRVVGMPGPRCPSAFPCSGEPGTPPSPGNPMRGLLRRTEVSAVWQLLHARVRALPAEVVELPRAAGRVLAADVTAEVAVPAFDRAAMDGYALRGEETFGCDAYNPLEFAIVGESFPARPFAGRVQPGQAVRIMTGAPLPEGADAVLQAEAAEEVAG